MDKSIMSRIEKLMEDGKAEELERLLDAMEQKEDAQDTTEAEDATAKEDNWESRLKEEDDDDWGEDENPWEECHTTLITDSIGMVQHMVDALKNSNIDAIPILPMPTMYGLAALGVFNGNYEFGIIKETLNKSGFDMLPVKSISLYVSPEKNVSFESLIYKPFMERETLNLAIIFKQQQVSKEYGYIFPVNGVYAGTGFMAVNPADMVSALVYWYSTLGDEKGVHGTMVLPQKGYKVMKESGCKGGTRYKEEILYTVDGDVIPHKNGIHYATDAKLLTTWYKNDYKENQPMVVQAGNTVVDAGDKIKATETMLVLKHVAWEEILR